MARRHCKSRRFLIFKRIFYRVDSALNRAGVVITSLVSSMWCAIAFGCLALISLPDALRGGRQVMVAWLAQTFLQLVLLSIIMVGQEVQSNKIEARDIEVHDTVMSSHEELKDSHKETHATLSFQNDVLARQDSLLDEIHDLVHDIAEKRRSRVESR